jgi:hypothetical protein
LFNLSPVNGTRLIAMTGDEAALRQLVEMGIPLGRARAALKRSKGDVMSAAVSGFDEVAMIC